MKVLLAIDLIALSVSCFYLFSGRLSEPKLPVVTAGGKKVKRK